MSRTVRRVAVVWPWMSAEQLPLPTVGERFFLCWTGAEDRGSASIEMLPVRLTRAAVTVLNVQGASLSVLSGTVRVPLGASDDAANAAERLQFTFGEGPCMAALHGGAAVHVNEDEIARRWPAMYAGLNRRHVLPFCRIHPGPCRWWDAGRARSVSGRAVSDRLRRSRRRQRSRRPDLRCAHSDISRHHTHGGSARTEMALRT